jgi:hypothetical protein
VVLFFATALQAISFVPIPYRSRSEKTFRLFACRNEIEAGIELFLQENPHYHSYNAWEHYLTTSGKQISPRVIETLNSLRKNNYSIDPFGYKSYILFEPQSQIYYPIQVLDCFGCYLGCSICLMNIVSFFKNTNENNCRSGKNGRKLRAQS